MFYLLLYLLLPSAKKADSEAARVRLWKRARSAHEERTTTPHDAERSD
jgi:hypothetical protein